MKIPALVDAPCSRFRRGCTCSRCLSWYFKTYANTHTYGKRAK